MSSLKPITLYSHASGPNPWKTAIILEELKLPYESKNVDMGDLKKVFLLTFRTSH
jgi:glutathione S-transferase